MDIVLGPGMGECAFVSMTSSKQSVVVEGKRRRSRDGGDDEGDDGGKSICEKLGVLFGS